MPREEFEAEVKRLDEIERQQRQEIADQKVTSATPVIAPVANTIHNDESATYQPGEVVKHPRFGLGTILADDGKLVEVKFDEGVKKMMKKFVQLEKVGA
jgi:hypothetical protein